MARNRRCWDACWWSVHWIQGSRRFPAFRRLMKQESRVAFIRLHEASMQTLISFCIIFPSSKFIERHQCSSWAKYQTCLAQVGPDTWPWFPVGSNHSSAPIGTHSHEWSRKSHENPITQILPLSSTSWMGLDTRAQGIKPISKMHQIRATREALCKPTTQQRPAHSNYIIDILVDYL
jgi:hypothetical protein